MTRTSPMLTTRGTAEHLNRSGWICDTKRKASK